MWLVPLQCHQQQGQVRCQWHSHTRDALQSPMMIALFLYPAPALPMLGGDRARQCPSPHRPPQLLLTGGALSLGLLASATIGGTNRTPVTVFRLDKKSPSVSRRNVLLAQNALSRLRTVRHPHILRFVVIARAHALVLARQRSTVRHSMVVLPRCFACINRTVRTQRRRCSS